MNLQHRLTKQLQTMSVWRREIFKWSRGDPEKDKQYAADLQREPLLVLGNVDPTNADLKQLHSASMHGRKKEIFEVLQKGIWVDFPNDAGQTALFCATLRGNYGIVEHLLQNGANPNEKSDTGMTPVHVACLKASIRSLAAMIEAGGDLRLHDNEGNGCLDWARFHPEPKRRLKMMEFLQKSQLFALNYSGDFVGNSLDRQPSILQMLRGKVGSQMSLDFGQDTALRRVHSHGYGRVYYGGESASGIVSVIPIMTENQLRHDSEGISFDSSSGFSLTGMLWNMTPISVKQPSKKLAGHHSVDLLISEVEHLSKLRHPNILLLMGLCQSSTFDKVMLAFERVSVGSLHYILHEKIDHLPMTYIRDVCSQVCQALVYIHGQNYLHCSLTSHAVCMVSMHQAKVSNLEYMVEMKKASAGRSCLVATSPHREHVFRWMAPEVMMGSPPNSASDVYSFCCVLWEMITSELPWKSKSADELLELHTSGSAKLPTPPKSVALFQSMIEEGLKKNTSRPRDFITLLQWLQGPLDQIASWKPSPVDRLKSLQRESKERISVSSRLTSIYDTLATASAEQSSSSQSGTSETSSSSGNGETSATQSILATVTNRHNVQKLRSATDKNVSRNHSDTTNNHCSAEQMKSAKASGSCSTADNNESGLDAEAVDGRSAAEGSRESPGSRTRLIVRSAGQIGIQQLTKDNAAFVKHQFDRSSSFSTAEDVQTYSRRTASLPWQGSRDLLRAGSTSAYVSRPSYGQFDRSVSTGSGPAERSSKTLPLVKPASHLTDIKDFAKDNTSGVIHAVDVVPRRTRRLSPRRSLPASRNFPMISPRAFPRSKSASGDVLEIDEKDVELSVPGSVRTLTEQFQAKLYNHNLRQSILRGSMTPQGILLEDMLESPSCTKQTPEFSEIPPEGSKETNPNSEDREILTVSSKGSSESLTSVSLQYESTADEDEDHFFLVSTRNDLDITDDITVSKPFPVYSPVSASFQCQPAANPNPRMFQGNSAFRKFSKQRAVEADSTDRCPDKPQRAWKRPLFLPSSLPGTDISSHPFDFEDYYIDDDYTGVGNSDDPSRSTSLKNRECEATHITDRSRQRVRSRVWLGDNKKGQRKKNGQCEKTGNDDEGQNWQAVGQTSSKNYGKESPDKQQRISKNQAPEIVKGETFHCRKDQCFESQWQEEDIGKKWQEEYIGRKWQEDIGKKWQEEYIAKKWQGEDIGKKWQEDFGKKWQGEDIAKKWQGEDITKKWQEDIAKKWQEDIAKKWQGEDIAKKWQGEDIAKKWQGEDIAKKWQGEDIGKKWQEEDTDKKQKPERDCDQESITKKMKEQADRDQTKETEKNKEQRTTSEESLIVEYRKTEGPDLNKERPLNWQPDRDASDQHEPNENRETRGRESRWEEFVRQNKKRSPTKARDVMETNSEHKESEESLTKGTRTYEDEEQRGTMGLWAHAEEDSADVLDGDLGGGPEGKNDSQLAAAASEEEEDPLLPESGESSLSTVVEKPLHALLPRPVSISDDDNENDNDTTLVPEDVVVHPRCIVLNLERNTLSQEDILEDTTVTTPPALDAGSSPTNDDGDVTDDAGSPLKQVGSAPQSTLRKFYLGSTAGSQGYTTTLKVESSLRNPGSHRITQTARDTGSGVTQTVHEETLQAETLRTTMSIQ